MMPSIQSQREKSRVQNLNILFIVMNVLDKNFIDCLATAFRSYSDGLWVVFVRCVRLTLGFEEVKDTVEKLKIKYSYLMLTDISKHLDMLWY
jgi:hypothetical protein